MTKCVGANSAAIVHFDVKLADGSAADSTRVNNKPAKMQLGDGSLTSGLEARLLGLTIGEKKSFAVNGDIVFGAANPDNIHHMDRTMFAADMTLEEGMIMAFSTPDGSEMPGIIRAVAGHSVTVDFNHPLAGQDVVFDVEVLDIHNPEDVPCN